MSNIKQRQLFCILALLRKAHAQCIRLISLLSAISRMHCFLAPLQTCDKNGKFVDAAKNVFNGNWPTCHPYCKQACYLIGYVSEAEATQVCQIHPNQYSNSSPVGTECPRQLATGGAERQPRRDERPLRRQAEVQMSRQSVSCFSFISTSHP